MFLQVSISFLHFSVKIEIVFIIIEFPLCYIRWIINTRIFRTLLRQEVAYYDKPENNTGALCTRLATEASDVQGVGIIYSSTNLICFIQATGVRIGVMLQNISNLGVGIIIAFVYGWSLTLLVLAFVPFMIVAGFLQTYLLTGFADRVSSWKKWNPNFICNLFCRINRH